MSGITVITNTAGSMLDRVKNAAQAAGLALVGARAVAQLTKDHLVQLDGERHKSGGRHYYLQAARSITSRGGGSGLALVTVTQTGFRQRLLGGPISPKAPRKYLTIPANPEAYGKRAGEFQDLEFAIVLDGNGALRPALVRRASTAISFTRRKRKDGSVKVTVKPGELRGGEVMFWLVRKVNQRPDPSVLPSSEQMNATAGDAITRRIIRLSDQGGNN